MAPVALYGDQREPIVTRNGRYISRDQFWSDVYAFRKLLPDSVYIINDCKDRYAFLVTLVAGLVNKKISLFPSSRTQRVFDQLFGDYHDVVCVTDQSDVVFGYQSMRIDINHFERTPDCSPLAIPGDQLALIAFTSGSTGSPKPHAKTWSAFLFEAKVAGISLGLDSSPVSRCIATMPAQHMYGFIASIMVPLYYGIAIEATCPFFPRDISVALSATKTSAMLITTPIQLRNCVLGTIALSNLSFILSSAATLDPEIAKQAEVLFNVPIYEFYGSTETGAIAFRETNRTDHWVTFQGISVREADKMLLVSSPHITDQVIQDYVRVISSTTFLLNGRASDIIKVSGKRTSLVELNRVLLSIAGVCDGVFYQPDPELEGRLTLIAVVSGLDKKALLSALRPNIDEVFLPRKIIFMDKLPRSESGKLPLQNIASLV